MTKRKAMKFRVNNEQECIAIQKYLFSQGYEWGCNGTEVSNTAAKYLFAGSDGDNEITYLHHRYEGDETYFNNHYAEEMLVTFKQQLVVDSVEPVSLSNPIEPGTKLCIEGEMFILAKPFILTYALISLNTGRVWNKEREAVFVYPPTLKEIEGVVGANVSIVQER